MVVNVWAKAALLILGIIIIALMRYYWPTSKAASVFESTVDEVVLTETGVDIDPKDPPKPTSV